MSTFMKAQITLEAHTCHKTLQEASKNINHCVCECLCVCVHADPAHVGVCGMQEGQDVHFFKCLCHSNSTFLPLHSQAASKISQCV